MRRREFITLRGGAALSPVAARAQVSPKRPLVAWLSGGAHAASLGFVDAFLQGMPDHGYIEGRDFDIVYRYADGYAERLPALAEELVRLKPNIILATATGQAVAAKNATTTIPIVTPALADAVHLGLVASEARPKGNVTGITPYVAGLPAKQMELAREIVPRARKIGVLNDINDPKAAPQWLELEDAGRALGLNVIALEVRTPDDLAGAFQALANQRPDAVIVLQTSMLLSERRKIAAFEAAKRWPIIYGYREHIVDGGLISYGVDLRDCFRRSAVYVVKIMNGTAPGDLPVEFRTRRRGDRMKRREFIALIGGAATWPLTAQAQQPGNAVIGFLGLTSQSEWGKFVAAFQKGLGEAGYVEGRNLTVEYRWAEGHYDRLPAQAADLLGRADRIAMLAQRQRLPTIFHLREPVAGGGLMSYGASFADAHRQAGVYVGRILKGEKPSDLPVLQPTKFDLVINLKAAKALGLTVPDKLLALADEVIE